MKWQYTKDGRRIRERRKPDWGDPLTWALFGVALAGIVGFLAGCWVGETCKAVQRIIGR